MLGVCSASADLGQYCGRLSLLQMPASLFDGSSMMRLQSSVVQAQASAHQQLARRH